MDERDVCERLRHAAAVLAEVRVGELDAQNVRNAMGELAAVRRHAGRLDVALAARAGELCDRGTGEDPVDLLTDVGAMPAKRARQVVGHAELLGRMPLLAAAVAAGTVSDDHVAAVATARRRVDPALRTELDRADEEITALAATHSPDALADRLRWLTSRIERQHQRQRSQRQARQARLTKWIDHDGMYQLRGAFDPDLGARIFTAVDTAVEALRQHPESLVPGHDPTDPLGVEPTFLAAHALAKLVGHGHMAQHPGLAEVVVLIDEMTLLDGSHDRSVCEFHDGSPADPDLVRRLCCDAIVRAVVVSADGRVPLSLGRTRRTANREQRRALRAVYRTCAIEGCTMPFDWCEIHHVWFWELDGLTDLDNLIPLCHRHHHLVHDSGWRLTLDKTDRTLTVALADGSATRTMRPAGLQPPATRAAPRLPSEPSTTAA